MLYRPLSLVVSVLGGILAGAVFKKVWAVASGEEAPEATLPEYSTRRCWLPSRSRARSSPW